MLTLYQQKILTTFATSLFFYGEITSIKRRKFEIVGIKSNFFSGSKIKLDLLQGEKKINPW